MKKISTTLIIFILLIQFVYSQTGSLMGTVIDKSSGDPLIGVNVYLENTILGSSTDLDGHYRIDKVPQGTYTLIGSFITYATQTIKDVEIKPDESLVFNFTMQESSISIKEVVVTAKAIENSEVAVLALQRKALGVQDGISSQEMDINGASNAAESSKQITGTSVVDGKYIYIRGLGDRYSMAQLNGTNLVSTDPYINSAPLDLIPSNLLENIITIKTATPDNPSDFSGGIVNLTTKSFPEKLLLNYSNSISFNPQSSFNKNFLSFSGGKLDWLGYNDGTYSMPSILQDKNNMALFHSPTFYIEARNNPESATLLDLASKSLNPQMSPDVKRSFTNYSTSFSFGNQYKLFNNPLGVIFGINQSRTYTYYEKGINQAWDITGSHALSLFNYYDLQDSKSTDNPIVSGIAGFTYRMGANNEISLTNIYMHDTEKMSRYQSGKIPGMVSGSDKVFETRTLQFTERGLNSIQLRGKHHLPGLHDAILEWNGSYSKSFQNEPDLRFFANENVGDSLYYISISEYDNPYHYFRYLNDKSMDGKVDLTIPFMQKSSKNNQLKFGINATQKKRDFNEYRFYFNNQDGDQYAGDQYAYFGTQNTGIIGYDSIYHKSIIGNYLVNDTKISNNYTGKINTTSSYAMAVLNLTNKLKFTGGFRLERTMIHVESADSLQKSGDINQFDLFPSANLIYALNEKTNIRTSLSQTIARPSMRELAPFATFDFIGGFIFIGNPELKTTLIQNYDFRLEHFIEPGEVIAFSAYYKHFKNPIVKVYNTNALNPEIIFQNTNDANVYGLELDLRKNLSFINSTLKDFKLNANFSYIFSRVDLDTSEYKVLAEINPEIDPYRPFQGQSPFLLNTILSYKSDKAGLEANLSYNLFGKRLAAIGLKGLPDVYDLARGLLNMSLSKALGEHWNVKLRLNNLLNAEYITLQTFKSSNYINESHRLGRTFSISASYSIK